MRWNIGLAALVLSTAAAMAASRGVDLAALQDWDIVIAGGAPPSVAYAAQELQAHVAQACGATLPIVTASARDTGRFFVGPGPAMAASQVGFAVDDFGSEDLRIVIRDGDIALAGGAPRGTLYAVYTFLEDYLNVRFLSIDHTHVPPAGAWRVVGPVDRFYSPPFAMRWSYYGEINRTPVFAARLRVNTVTRDARLGGVTGITNINHSFFRQIPSQTYGKEHPEYYCLRNGERLWNVDIDVYGNEPCLTHPDVLRIVTESVLAEIAAHPNHANVSVSQNDNDKYCTCEHCAAIDAREGTPMGSLLTFVNAVAEKVAEKHPGIKVGTLSYWYSRRPPAMLKPHPNVQIQLCSIECCLIHAIDDPRCPQNAAFCRDMRHWGAICSHISIWNYNTNFSNYLLPCPNLRTIEPNVRFFAANQAKGVFMQAAGNAWAAELSELRNYLICRLLWDPNRSAAALQDEFLRLHYGKAADPIRRYITLIHDTAEASGAHRNCFAGSAGDYGIDASVAPAALALFEEALGRAENATVKRRVEKASIAAYRLAIDPVWNLDLEWSTGPAAQAGFAALDRLRPHVARFLELCAEFQVDRASEHRAFSMDRERLQRLLAPHPAREKK